MSENEDKETTMSAEGAPSADRTAGASSPSLEDATSEDSPPVEEYDEDALDIEEPPEVADPAHASSADDSIDDAIARLEVELELSREKLRVKADQLVRLAADFDNYKKRSRREIEREKTAFAERLFRKLLPTLDAMDRAKQSVEDGDALDHLREGLTQIHVLFRAALAEVDVTPMDCFGKPFDPNFHEALMLYPSPGAAPNTVTAELQKGWLLGDVVLRAARVGVAPDESPPDGAAPLEPSVGEADDTIERLDSDDDETADAERTAGGTTEFAEADPDDQSLT